ncbi:MAG: RNA 2',3'-cyclic phosphodiesterase [Patescibacteria group bacterium]|nr:RNA 2',3'-cyclic phosphodiesterase [Patescibacteria group bacterium]
MRCFLGIPVPADCREQIRNAWHITEEERPFLRMVDPGQWHVTMAYFGDIKYDSLIKLSQLISNALETPPQGSFEVCSIETFPAKRPILYVAKCEPEQKVAWQETVANIRDMASLIAPQIDRKPWVPHVTLARARNKKDLDQFEMSLEGIGWVPDYATLFLSELTPAGPKYTPLHEYRLNN